MLFVNFYCSLLHVLVLGAYFHLPFVAFLLFVARSCFEIESGLSQKPKQANAFGCPFEHRIAHFGFSLVRTTKTSNRKGQKCPNGTGIIQYEYNTKESYQANLVV